MSALQHIIEEELEFYSNLLTVFQNMGNEEGVKTVLSRIAIYQLALECLLSK